MRNTITTTKPTTRKQLNNLQIEALLVLYKFRFATAELIGDYQQQIVRYSNARLKILLEQEYIGRNYDSSYRIKQRPATYFLVSKGIRFLKATQEIDSKGLHLSYHSHKVKPEFITHWLRIFRIYLKLDELFGDNLEFYTNAELAEQGIYPKPRPDALLSFSGKHGTIPDCMLDVIESSKQATQIRRHITRFISHYEQDSDWGRNYPRVLLVCDNVGLEREVQRIVTRTLNMRGLSKPLYYTTTLKALYGMRKADTPIWTDMQKLEEPVALTAIT